jgi:hypothetical protein
VSDDEFAVVEDVVAHEAIEEGCHLGAEFLGFGRELLDGLGEAVGDLHISAAELLRQLDVVIAGDADGGAGLDHAHGEAEHRRDFGAAVDEVADEDRFATGGRNDAFAVGLVAEASEETEQLVVAAVDVADDIEGAVFVLAVVPEGLALDGSALDLFGRGEDMDVAEAFAFEAAQGAAELLDVLMDDVRAEGTVGAAVVALGAEAFGEIENDGDGEDMVGAGEGDERLACFGLDVGGVDDGEAAGAEAFGGDEVEDLEGVGGGGLVVLVVGDEAAAVVGGEDFGGKEVLFGKGRLAAAGGSDEEDEGEIGDGEGHRVKTPI